MKLSTRSRRVITTVAELLVLAALTYIPLLLTKPGMVSADTKQYLYLDAGRFMSQVLSMWASWFAAGTVTHQYIGYILPQGPFYAGLAALHVPVWVAQRLWFGSLLFLAGAGVRFAVRTFGLRGPGPLVAGAVYALSPYSMQYIERISAILMPWAGLGWLLGFTVLAIRRGGWRYPALFASVVALVGGINATSLIYVGVAPLGFVLYTLFVTKEARAVRVVWAAVKIGLLSLAVSLWWIAGLAVEGAYGINVLKYTETVPAIANTSVASEVMRGLGYWYFYGTDRLGPWLSSSVVYTQDVALLVVSFALPVLGVLAAVLIRWRARAYFALLGLTGLVLSVGTHPFNHPSGFGGLLKAFMDGTTAGFALRSTDRATPLVVLSLAAFTGAGISALHERARAFQWPRVVAPMEGVAWVPALLVVALAAVNAGPLMTGQAVDSHFDRPSNIPSYFYSAAKYLDALGNSTRVLVEPGDDFADYDWGNTIDPVWPGILTRPEVDRAQLIDGSDQTADLLQAFDTTLQQGTYEPSTLAPIARLLSAGDVVLESDYKYWHYDTPAPKPTWQLFDPPPAGIGQPIAFGPAKPNVPPKQYALLNEQALATSPSAPWPPAVAVFPVSDARPIYRAEPASSSLVLDGSGAGVVSAAATGLLDDNPTIFYAGSLDGNEKLLREAVQSGATLVLTDTNRKEVERWASESANIGETLPAVAEPQVADPTSQPLPLFATSSLASQSVATYSEAHYVTASAYGNPVTLTPEDRPYMALDGNQQTAWSVSAFSPAGGQWLQVSLDTPVTTNHIQVVQPAFLQPNRWIGKVTLTFDGKHSVVEKLSPASHTKAGQTLTFPTTTFSTLRITIDTTTWTGGSNLTAASAVGFAEVGIPGVNIHETIQMPSDLLSALGQSSLSHRLVVILTRQKVSPDPPRSDPEPTMSRTFKLPTARTFTLGGDATISALIPDNEIDDILGGPGVFGGNVLGSNERLPGDLNARAVNTFDGNPATWWGPGFGAKAQIGAWMQANLTHPVTFDHLNLQVLADGEHSVPTKIEITTNTGQKRVVSVPAITDGSKAGDTETVRLTFPAVTGSVLRFTVKAVRQETTTDWYTEQPIVLPFAIAEIGVPGLHFTPENPASEIPPVCRDNLMTVDGKPVWLKVTGKVGTAEDGGDLTVSGCGPDAKGIKLGPGTHDVETAWGDTTGLNLDRVVLDSAAGGSAEPLGADGTLTPVPGTLGGGGVAALPTPKVTGLSTTATSARLVVSGATSPFWLVLGESVNKGWEASIAGGAALGSSSLIDAFANGWYVVPGARHTFEVDLVWRPQKKVDEALVVSAAAALACLLMAVVPFSVRRRRSPATSNESPARAAHARRRRTRWRITPTGNTAGGRPEDPPAVAEATDAAPAPAFPWSRAGHPTSIIATVVIALLCAVATWAVVPAPWAGPAAAAVGATSLVAARLRGFRTLLALAAVGGSVAAGAITILGQLHHHFPPGDSWPANFEPASIVTLVAFAALAADALVEAWRLRPGRAPASGRDAASSGAPSSTSPAPSPPEP